MDYINEAKEYLLNYNFKESKDKKHGGFVYLGGILLYNMTHDKAVKDAVISFADEMINEDGSIKEYDREAYAFAPVIPGRIYIFAYKETGVEKYKKAADILMEQLLSQPRSKYGIFCKKGFEDKEPCFTGFDAVYPFYALYGTDYSKKENYNDLTAQLNSVYDMTAVSERSTKELAKFACGLADVVTEVSEEIYEHKRGAADKLKAVLKELVKRTDMTDEDKIFASKALLKGSFSHAVLAEKYVPAAIKLYSEAKKNTYDSAVLTGAAIEAAVFCAEYHN